MVKLGYGNYCGPWWSDGQVQSSVDGTSEPVDDLDELCRRHDKSYYHQDNLIDADASFASAAISHGPYGVLFGSLVGMQYASRVLKNSLSGNFQTNDYRMRGSKSAEQKKKGTLSVALKQAANDTKMLAAAIRERKKNGVSANLGGVQMSAPNAISHVMTAIPTKTRTINDGIVVSGREFVGTVEGNGLTIFGTGKSALLAPAYFYSGILGQLSRAYQYYKWKRLIVHYIPKVATTVNGQVVMCSSENIDEPFLVPESSTLLPRAIVAGNGVMTPPWCPVRMEIKCDNQRRFIDPSVNVDINENIFCELQVYSQISTAVQCGYLWLEYEVELTSPMLQPHSTQLPFVSGPGQRVALVDTAAVNAVSAPVLLSELSGNPMTSSPNGTIFRCVFDLAGSSAGAGTTFGNAWNVVQLYRNTAGTAATTPSSIAINGGLTLYMVVVGTTLALYSSIEQATSGFASGEIVQRTASLGAGSYSFDVAIVRVGNAIMPTVQ